MENNLITKDHEKVKSFFLSLERMLNGIEGLVENSKPSFSSCKHPICSKKKLGKPFPKFTLSAGKEEILRKPEAWA